MEKLKEELKEQLPQKLFISNNCIRLLENVGQGEFGEVYRAHFIKYGRTYTVAVKTLKGLFLLSDLQQMMQEVVKMQEFEHPRVMSLIGVCLESGVGIVMPYMANGSVLNYLKREKATLLLDDEANLEMVVPVRKLLLRMCLQIAEGMEYLAAHKFVHRDLAARNCMLDNKGNVKVGDFGLAEDMYSIGYIRDTSKTLKVPYKWMALEGLQEGLFSEHSDVWSYGVTCWEIFTVGQIPYPALDPPTLLSIVRNGHRLEYPDNPACSPDIYKVMKKCWKLVPSDRPTFTDLVSSQSKILASVADYVELSMALQSTEPEPQYEEADHPTQEYEEIVPHNSVTAGEEIKLEPNLEYGMVSDSIPTEPNPLYGMRSESTSLQVVGSESITNELHPVNGVSESSTGTRHISTSPTTGDN